MANLYYKYDYANRIVYFSNTQESSQFLPWTPYQSTAEMYIGAESVVISGDRLILPDSIGYMFYNCTGLTTLDLSKCDASNVTTMASAFSGCTNLQSIDFSNWNTSSLITMTQAFQNCSSLISLDLSSFDTSNVNHMGLLFYRCYSLESVNLINFDLSKVTSTMMMFSGCSLLQHIYVNKSRDWRSYSFIDTDMFSGCTSLPNWNGVTNKTKAYVGAEGYFEGLKLYYWYDSANTTVHFSNSKLTENYKDWIAGSSEGGSGSSTYYAQATKVITDDTTLILPSDISYMFNHCENLTELDVSSWDTLSVQKTIRMFAFCTNLISLDLSNWEVANINDATYMFARNSNLENINMSGWNLINAVSLEGMFYSCSKLTSISIPHGCYHGTKTISWMFAECTSLTFLDITEWDTSGVENMSRAFELCKSIVSLDLTSWDVSNATDAAFMFAYCENLEHIYVTKDTDWRDGIITEFSGMFSYSRKLPNYDPRESDISRAYAGGNGLGYFNDPSIRPVYIKKSGQWKKGTIYRKSDFTWCKGQVYTKDYGQWKK